jgi:hypothetical protein
MEAFRGIVDKMSTKLQPWKGRNLSSGGGDADKYVPEQFADIHYGHVFAARWCLCTNGFNMSQIFLEGDIEKFKYHMIKWENVCLPKEFGGAGVVNTKLFNKALILKWVWRLLNCEEEDVCCQLLRAKYFPKETFIRSKSRGAHSFGWGFKV